MSSRLSRNGRQGDTAPVRAMGTHGPGTRSIENVLYEPDEIIRQTELKQRNQEAPSGDYYQNSNLKLVKSSLLMRNASGLVDRDNEQQTITLKQVNPRRMAPNFAGSIDQIVTQAQVMRARHLGLGDRAEAEDSSLQNLDDKTDARQANGARQFLERKEFGGNKASCDSRGSQGKLKIKILGNTK